MKEFENFEDFYRHCADYGDNHSVFDNPQFYGFMLLSWNYGYRLGRRRWHWGPSWLVTVIGWVNTQISRVKGERT
jgi:hypothetical protein